MVKRVKGEKDQRIKRECLRGEPQSDLSPSDPCLLIFDFCFLIFAF